MNQAWSTYVERSAYKFLLENLLGKGNLRDLDVDGRVELIMSTYYELLKERCTLELASS
jgi:hypothetical protein